MVSGGNKVTPENMYRTCLIIAAALILSNGIYAGIVYMGGTIISFEAPAPDLMALKYIMALLGALMFPVSLAFRNYLLNVDRIAARAVLMGARAKSAEGIGEAAQTALAQMFVTGHIIPLALTETMGIYGLVAYLVTGDKSYAYALIGAGFAAMVPHFPRKSVYNDMLARLDMIMMMMDGKKKK